jgi:hypothetical protein
LRLAEDGRMVGGTITHFSNLAVVTRSTMTATLVIANDEIPIGGTMQASLTFSKTVAADRWELDSSRFEGEWDYFGESINLSSGPIFVTMNRPPPLPFTFDFNTTPTVTGQYVGTCQVPGGTGTVSYLAELGDVVFTGFIWPFFSDIHVYISRTYTCIASGTTVPTGVRQAPLSGLDVVEVVSRIGGIFGFLQGSENLASGPIDASSGALAVLAGAEGMVIVDLVTGETVLDWTTSGPERDVLRSPLIGVLPVTRPGANAPAALFGYRNNGTALRGYDPQTGFGATNITFSGVLDATTVGGDVVSDAFISVSPGGVQFYGFDTALGFYRSGVAPPITSLRFPGGELVTGFRVAASSAVLAASRGHDGNTTSRLWAHAGSGTQEATSLATLGAEVRRLRCLAPAAAGGKHLCGVTSASGSVAFFNFDAAAPFAALTPLTVTTAGGSLGIALGRRDNGNPYAVVANFDADSLNVIEVTPGLALAGNTTVAAPTGCTRPAHVDLLADSEGVKAVITCNGSASLWVHRLFQ